MECAYIMLVMRACAHVIRMSCSLALTLTNHRTGHSLALDGERMEVFCLKCNDYVYLEAFDKAVLVSRHCDRWHHSIM